MPQLILKRAGMDFDVLADGIVVGRIMKAAAAPVDALDVDSRLWLP
jgi:hypothetical protein